MKRTWRHPISGSKQYLRPERERFGPRKVAKQPRIHKNRVSVGSMLDAPDSTAARPGLRLRITGLVVIALFAILGLRLWTLQVLQAPAAVHAVSANQIRAVAIPPTRGEILDSTGLPLVNNIVTQQITLSRVQAANDPQVVGSLAALIGQTPAQVQQTINDKQYSPYKPVPILDNAPLPDVLYIKEHPADFPGVEVVQTTERNYPQAEIPGPAAGGYPAAQTLGYVGSISADELKTLAAQGYQAGDQVGQTGLEAQYESALRGTPGQQQLEVDAQGQVVGTLKTLAAKSGDNLVTNINLGLQQVADDALATQIATVRQTPDAADNNALPPAINGSVVVMNPQTGAILAMSSYPSYNPTVWVGGISQANYAALQATNSLNNWAINSQLAPGSTFKLVTATSALQTGLITPDTAYVDNGGYTAPNCTGPNCHLKDDVGDNANGAAYNVSSALTVSSDAFFYQLGAEYWGAQSQYGKEPIQTVAAQYGYGGPTGIDIPNESIGRVDSPSERVKLHQANPTAFPNTAWYTGDNMELAFGQGGTVITPLQEAVAYSTFANGGTRYAPQVAAGVVSPDGKVISKAVPKVTGHVDLSPTNYQALLTGFEGVVNDPNGTGYGSFVGSGWNQPAFTLGGKTGTASVGVDAHGNPQEPTSWFVGFGPNPNPQYVVVSEINEGGYGAQASAPVVRKIFDYLSAHPVTAPVLPPASASVNSSGAAPLPATTTTTAPGSTTTTPGPGSTTTPSTDGGSTTTTTPGTAVGTGAADRRKSH